MSNHADRITYAERIRTEDHAERARAGSNGDTNATR
jgi:hypothetical protein